jgi:hypothetical protein
MKSISKLTSCCLLIFIFSLFAKAYGQALTSEEIKLQYVKEWERAKAYTVDYLNTMPASKYSFKAVDSIRSFAQQMIHLAQGNLFLMSKATGIAPPAWANSDLEKSRKGFGDVLRYNKLRFLHECC